MIKQAVISLTLIMAFCLLGIVVASVIVEYMFPSTGTITETKATIYVAEIPTPDGTTISWDSMARGETWYINFTVQNTGTTTFKVILHITDIPIGISYVWAANNTIVTPGAYAKADLELTVGSSAVLGTYSMGTYHILLDDMT